MQENHSFDNYFGALAYAKGNPYKNGPCKQNDHLCVDGLSSCTQDASGNITCPNSNPDDEGSTDNTVAFHNTNYCVSPDLDHSWPGSHKEANFSNPSNTLFSPTPNDGFVLVAETLEDMFDFDNAPSMNTTIPQDLAPSPISTDCKP